jgi:hypothetical protein
VRDFLNVSPVCPIFSMCDPYSGKRRGEEEGERISGRWFPSRCRSLHHCVYHFHDWQERSLVKPFTRPARQRTFILYFVPPLPACNMKEWMDRWTSGGREQNFERPDETAAASSAAGVFALCRRFCRCRRRCRCISSC